MLRQIIYIKNVNVRNEQKIKNNLIQSIKFKVFQYKLNHATNLKFWFFNTHEQCKRNNLYRKLKKVILFRIFFRCLIYIIF